MTDLITRFGALGVFMLMVPESACIPIPSEVTLLFAGFAVGQGWMNPALAVLAATAGNLTGSLLAYGLGASGAVDRIPGARVLVGRWEGMIDRYGTRAVFTARLLPLARTFVSLPAGARHVPLGPFVALTTVGCLLWAVLFIAAGVVAGAAWSTASTVVGQVTVAVLIAAGLIWLWRVVHCRG